MNIVVHDTQDVPESGSYSGKELMFEMIQQSPIAAHVIMRNTGSAQINYVWQEWNGTTWVDLDDTGTDLNGTLASGANGFKLVTVESSNAKVRLLANASGGSELDFTITRFHVRASSGPIPILSL